MDPLDHPADLANPAEQATKVATDPLDDLATLDLPADLDHQEMADHPDHLETPEALADLANLATEEAKEPLDPVETTDLPDQKDDLDHLADKPTEDNLDALALLDHLALLALLDSPVVLDHPVPREHLDKMPNTVLAHDEVEFELDKWVALGGLHLFVTISLISTTVRVIIIVKV